MTFRTLCAFGTRPEAIKLAPLALALAADPRFEAAALRHGPASGDARPGARALRARARFRPRPDDAGQDLTDVTCGVLRGMRGVFAGVRPTACWCRAIPRPPWPPRSPPTTADPGRPRRGGPAHRQHLFTLARGGQPQADGALAALHFAPTERGARRLLAEGIDAGDRARHRQHGDRRAARGRRPHRGRRRACAPPSTAASASAPASGSSSSPATAARTSAAASSDLPALAATARAAPRRRGDLPVHLNPNVQEPVRRLLSGIAQRPADRAARLPALRLLMHRAHLILTDSGGVQEEAPALGKPVLVMRDTTERPEAVAAGTVRLVGTDERAIVAEIDRLLADPAEYERMSSPTTLSATATPCSAHPRRSRTARKPTAGVRAAVG